MKLSKQELRDLLRCVSQVEAGDFDDNDWDGDAEDAVYRITELMQRLAAEVHKLGTSPRG